MTREPNEDHDVTVRQTRSHAEGATWTIRLGAEMHGERQTLEAAVRLARTVSAAHDRPAWLLGEGDPPKPPAGVASTVARDRSTRAASRASTRTHASTARIVATLTAVASGPPLASVARSPASPHAPTTASTKYTHVWRDRALHEPRSVGGRGRLRGGHRVAGHAGPHPIAPDPPRSPPGPDRTRRGEPECVSSGRSVGPTGWSGMAMESAHVPSTPRSSSG
jgi:hypothetical protein